MLERLLLAGLAVLVSMSLVAVAHADEEDTGVDDDFESEVIDMTPDDAVGFSMRNVVAPVRSIFQGGLGYWYSERAIEIDTTPSGGFVDLFYVRRNFQKRFEQAQAPVTVILPPRVKTGPRDALVVRAFQEGYRQQSVTVPVASRKSELVINLEPLPNTLSAVSHRYFGGRSTLMFLTTESPTFRVQEKDSGFNLILSETAQTSEAAGAIAGISSPMIEQATSRQVGEDFMVSVSFVDNLEVDLRSRLDRDAARDLFTFSLDVLPSQGRGESVAAAQAALARITSDDVSGCRLAFDTALRESLDRGSLSRALTPKGAFTDPYMRAAMRRLGEVSANDGQVEFDGGLVYRPTVPIELEVSLSQAAEARGYLALLRAFVRELEASEYRRETLRSLIAPELDSLSFGEVVDKAFAKERECAASR
jgi:hypothetical protein